MATQQEIHQTIIGPLATTYQPSVHPEKDPDGYAVMVEQFVDVLADFSVAELRFAYDRWRCEWHWKSWPVPGLMRKYAAKARDEISPQRSAVYRSEPDTRTAGERQRMAYQLGQWRLWMQGKAPKNTYPTHPRFSPQAQADWLLHESAIELDRRKLADMIAEVAV